MRKKIFFARAFAFAALTGLLAVAPLGENVQGIAAEGDAQAEGSTSGGGTSPTEDSTPGGETFDTETPSN